MHMLAHSVKPLIGARQYSLRALKGLSRLYKEAKGLRIDSRHETGFVKRADLHCLVMIAAVYQIHAIA